MLDNLYLQLGTLTKQIAATEENLKLMKEQRNALQKQILQAKVNACIEKNGEHDMYYPGYKWVSYNHRICRNCPYETGR